MIDLEYEIKKKFPKLNIESSFIKKSLIKVAKKLIHEIILMNFY